MTKHWRWALNVARWTVFFFLCGMLVLGWLVAFVAYSEDFQSPPGPADAIVVLGAQVKPWGGPSEALFRRMELALEHYWEQPRLIIGCGGQGPDEPMAEGDFIYQWMLEQGIPEEHLMAENTSRNTRENIDGAKAIMEERGLETALVITSDYHLARSLATCRQAGLVATGDGCESDPLLWWRNHVRESLSWMKFWIGL